jgi:uncharacterized membrane protein YfcA
LIVFPIVATVHLNVPTVLFLIGAGLIAGAVNAIAGGGSLLTFPALLAIGYPAVQANVSNTVALVPGYVGGSIAYRPELKGQRKRIVLLGLVSAVGGLTGAIILLVSPGATFRAIVPWLILLSCGLLAVQPVVTGWVQQQTKGAEMPAPIQVVGQFLAAVYGGYFGAGLGVMMLALLGLFLHDTLQRLNALKGLMSFVINFMAAAVFVIFGPVAWAPVVIMAAAALVGGNLGVRVARRMKPQILRSVVIAIGVVVAIKLLI